MRQQKGAGKMTLRSRSLTAWLLGVGFIFCSAVNLPGHLSFDSIVQLDEGRSGIYGNWHPPMMSWLLGVFDRVLPGTALFVVFDTALLFGALGVLLWLRKGKISIVAAVVLAGCILTPQFVLYQGIVWKDVLFANLAIAGFAALAVAGERWSVLRSRLTAVSIGIVLLSVATLVRQNGGVVLPVAATAIAILAWKLSSGRRLCAAAKYGIATLAGSALAVILIHAPLTLRIRGDASPTVQFRLLEFYDLIGALKTDPSLKLRYFGDDDAELERLMRTDGVRLYTPERNDTLAQSARLQDAYFSSPQKVIPEEWRYLIAAHSGLYLRVRAEVFRWVFLTPDLPACRPIYSGLSGPDPQMKTLGLKPRFDTRDEMLGSYAHWFEGTPIFSHAFFALMAVLMLVPLFARREPADVVMGFLLLSAFTFVATYFVISIACDYRYLYFLDLATLATAFHLSLDWRSAWGAMKHHFGNKND